MSRAAPNLESLPQELFDNVLSHLVYRYESIRDYTWVEGTRLRAIRLTSRRLRELSDSIFFHAAISVREVDLTTASLHNLRVIAERYGRHVRKVVVERRVLTAERYDALREGRLERFEDDEGLVRDETIHARNLAELATYEEEKAERVAVEQSGTDRKLLAEIFAAVPNVKTVEILVPLHGERGAWYKSEQRSEEETTVLCNVVLGALSGSQVRLEAFVVRSQKMLFGNYDTPYGYLPYRWGGFESEVFAGLEELTLPLAFRAEELEQGKSDTLLVEIPKSLNLVQNNQHSTGTTSPRTSRNTH
jgi:hypothetical protein